MDSEDHILYINDEGVIPEALSLVKTPVHLSEINGASVSFFIAIWGISCLNSTSLYFVCILFMNIVHWFVLMFFNKVVKMDM